MGTPDSNLQVLALVALPTKDHQSALLGQPVLQPPAPRWRGHASVIGLVLSVLLRPPS